MRARFVAAKLALVGAALVALTGSGALQTGTPGLVAFSRDGNVFVCNLDGTGERQITYDGGRESDQGTTYYGCPTLVTRETMVFLAWSYDRDGYDTTQRAYQARVQGDGVPTAYDGIEHAMGLGYSQKEKHLYYLKLGKRMEGEEGDWGADLILTRVKPDGTQEATGVHSWNAETRIDHCRLRFSHDGTLVTVPRNATDVSSYYGFHWLDGTEDTDLEEWLGGDCLNGVDLSPGGVYGVLALVSGEPLPGRGLYALNVADRRKRLIVELPKPEGVAVCSAAGIAVVESDGALKVVDLKTRSVRQLFEGVDPDVYPK
jgi:hypothetical protein